MVDWALVEKVMGPVVGVCGVILFGLGCYDACDCQRTQKRR